jgi:hypothetical protein
MVWRISSPGLRTAGVYIREILSRLLSGAEQTQTLETIKNSQSMPVGRLMWGASLSNSGLNYPQNSDHDSRLNPEEHVLSSWKEIAAYFGKGVRTVQRYERELGLPVRRPNDLRHIVFAYPSELRSWLDRFKSRSVLPSR